MHRTGDLTPASPAPAALRAWLLVCALLNASGWILSALGHLDARGYTVALPLCGVIVVLCLRGPPPARFSVVRWRRRFARPFPLAFLALSSLALLGGALYAPDNFDALAYRTPRVLHWLAEQRWHWIASWRGWLNTRACGFEWVSAPLLLFLKSDRILFLLNFASFLLLPGLVFSVLRRLVFSRRVAWYWMWLVPAGLCFVLQAGSLANDLFGVVPALAAVDFALRARTTNRPADLWYSVLAAALMTGAKGSNLTLLLPWLIAVLPSLRWLWWRPAAALAVAILAALSSLLPTAVLNHRHCGDWTGLAAESAWMKPPGPVTCAVHNAGLLLVQNFAPPVFPVASAWNRAVQNVLPEWWKKTLDGFAEEGRASYRVRELPGEEQAGLGFGLSLLLGAQLAAGFRRQSWTRLYRQADSPEGRWRLALLLSPLVSLGVFMSRSGIAPAARLIAPYYGLLLPLTLCLTEADAAVKSRWWRGLAWLSFGSAFVALILTPARPLWPAETVLAAWPGRTQSAVLERARIVYTVYRNRPDSFAPLRAAIPPEVRVLGLVTAADAEGSLWRPFGQRRVIHVLAGTTAAELERRQVEMVVVDASAAPTVLGRSMTTWLAEVGGSVVTNLPLRMLASSEPADFALVRLHRPPAK